MKNLYLYLLLLPKIVFAQLSQFNPALKQATVALYKEQAPNRLAFQGTGFIVVDTTQRKEKLLVTCEHVLRNGYIIINVPISKEIRPHFADKKTREVVLSEIKRQFPDENWRYDGYNFLQKVELKSGINYFSDNQNDIGIVKFNQIQLEFRQNDSIQIMLTTLKSMPLTRSLSPREMAEGTDLYFIGFPMGIGTIQGMDNFASFYETDPNPVIRHGILSWKSDQYPQFLIDAFSYGGNSGSPVLTAAVDNWAGYYIAGMVLGHLPDQYDVTQQRSNSGLARAIDIKYIIDLVKKIPQ